jgi:hypothetical protein
MAQHVSYARCLCGDPGCSSCGPAQGYRYPPLSAEQEALIEQLADQMLAERLYTDTPAFLDLMDGIEYSDFMPQLQRCLRDLDAACKGDKIALDAITTALSQIQKVVKAEAERLWLDGLREQATREIAP